MKTLETIRVVLEATSGPLKKEIRKVREEMRACTKDVDAQMDKASESIEKAQAPVKGVTGAIQEMNRKIREFSDQAALDAGIKKYSDNYLELRDKIDDTGRHIDSLKKKADQLSDADKFELSQEYKDLDRSIADAEKSMEKLEAQKQKMEQSGKAYEFTEEYQAVSDQMEQVREKLDSLVAKQKKWDSYGVGSDAESYKTLQKNIQDTIREFQYLEGEMDYLKENGEDKIPTAGFKELTAAIEEAKGQVSQYQEKKKQMESDGTHMVESRKWKNITSSINEAISRNQAYKEQAAGQISSGAAYVPVNEGFSSGSKIQEMAAVVKAGAGAVGPALSQMKNRMAGVIKEIPLIGRFVTESSYLAQKGFSLAAFAASKMGAGIKRAGGAAASLIQRFVSGIPVVRRFTSAAKGAGGSGQKLGNIFKTIGMTARFMFASFVIQGALNGAKEGFNNLSQYSAETNRNLSALMSGLTQLKNSLAAAFEPILSVVTPILSQLIDYLVGASNALAQFFAALTGKSSYTVAKRVNADYAASLDKTAGSADGANKAAKDLKRTLLGFDEVNKLGDDSSGFGSSGSGGGGAGTNGADMFTTETVNSQFADFAKMVKEAWEKADFTEIGTIVGAKLKNALDSIPWDGIKAGAEKIAKSTATFINGFFATPGLFDSIGRTVGEGINTGLVLANTFLEAVDWDQIGKSIATGLNSAVNTVDWKSVGNLLKNHLNALVDVIYSFSGTFDFKNFGDSIGTALTSAVTGIKWSKGGEGLGKLATGLFDALDGVLKGTDWKALGKGVTTAISGFFAEFKWSSVSSTLSHLFSGLLDTLSGLIQGVNWRELPTYIVDSIVSFITGFDYKTALKSFGTLVASALKAGLDLVKGLGDLGANLIEGILNGGADVIIGIPKWIKNNIFGPFIDGFKSVFGIHSPAKNEQIVGLGTNIMAGILNGITGALGNLGSWVKTNVFDKIQGAFSKAGDFVLGVGAKVSTTAQDLWNGVKSGWDTVKNKTVEIGNKLSTGAETLAANFKSGWDNVKDKTVNVINNLANGAEGLIKGFKEEWKNKNPSTMITDTLKNGGEKLLKVFKKEWKSKKPSAVVTDTLKNGASNLASTLKSNFNKLADSKKTLNFKGNVTKLTVAKQVVDAALAGANAALSAGQKATGGIYKNGHWQGIAGYASGGTPNTGQVFMAREAGPELVGTIGRHTSVMNNNQIVSSVSAGVYSAVLAAMQASGGERNIVITLAPDAKGIFRIVKTEAENYASAYGASPFPV
ncbi:MAG TPA: hypothetical protein DF613_16745 [Lachnospiraceae bacterium]|nr:hypothetical protein [Lachnospiraceae bacterium]